MVGTPSRRGNRLRRATHRTPRRGPYTWRGVEALEPRVLLSSLGPPQITGVLLNSTSWTPAFLTYLQDTAQGVGGYAIPVGSGAAQLEPVSWTNVDQIKVRFSEPVVIAPSHVKVTGVNNAAYAPSNFDFDDGTSTLTLTFAAPLGADRYQLYITDAVQNAAGDALDGDWDMPLDAADAASDTFPSGQGDAGGAFVFQFNVLPGDVVAPALVLSTDVNNAIARAGSSAQFSPARYSARTDVDGSGFILSLDVNQIIGRAGSRLPDGLPAPPPGFGQLRRVEVASGLSDALGLVDPGDGSGRLFIVEQGGFIRILQGGSVLATPFLNIGGRLGFESGGEKGLLGLAFHPDFASPGADGNGKFYIYYSADASGTNIDHKSIVAEFSVSDADADIANPNPDRALLEFNEPQSNHNGGDLHFGPDDHMLYISTGDGGGGGDDDLGHSGATTNNDPNAFGNAQDRHVLLGKILRIDVGGSNGPGGQYGIPADNPFVNDADADVRKEIFAYGLRNPFRMSFDDGELGAASADRLFVGDVGQSTREEVDIVESGGNYGWRIREGLTSFAPQITPDPVVPLLDPIADYPRSVGFSVIGGYVYRGRLFPLLKGKYLFGDLGGRLMGLEMVDGAWVLHTNLSVVGGNPTGLSIHSFGQDAAGEIYLVSPDRIFRLEAVSPFDPAPPPPAPPAVATAVTTAVATAAPAPAPSPSPAALLDGAWAGGAAAVTLATGSFDLSATLIKPFQSIAYRWLNDGDDAA